jgi:hypothetical protein
MTFIDTLGRMITPQQFLECFLQEKTAAWAQARPHLTTVYTKYFGHPLSQHAEEFMPIATVRAIVEDVKQSAGSATGITREHFKSADIRTRYHLLAIEETWKIVRIDRQCFVCSGTGRSGSSQCKACGGEGWHDPRGDAA